MKIPHILKDTISSILITLEVTHTSASILVSFTFSFNILQVVRKSKSLGAKIWKQISLRVATDLDLVVLLSSSKFFTT